jgi:hypothetical protein
LELQHLQSLGCSKSGFSDSQRQQLDPLVRRQVLDRKGLLLVSVVPSMQEGATHHVKMHQKF